MEERMTISQFLRARIAEDRKNYPTPSMPFPSGVDYEQGMCGDCGGVSQARWLRECEAKERILELLETFWDNFLFEAAQAVANVYSDHPDWRDLPDWDPEN